MFAPLSPRCHTSCRREETHGNTGNVQRMWAGWMVRALRRLLETLQHRWLSRPVLHTQCTCCTHRQLATRVHFSLSVVVQNACIQSDNSYGGHSSAAAGTSNIASTAANARPTHNAGRMQVLGLNLLERCCGPEGCMACSHVLALLTGVLFWQLSVNVIAPQSADPFKVASL